MSRRAFLPRAGIATAVLVVAVPAAAWGGSWVGAADHQSLRLSVSVSPDTAGARVRKLHIHSDYRNSTGNGQQPPVNGAAIVFKVPRGMTFHSVVAHACRESVVIRAPSAAPPCPASAKIGSGSVVVNARPTIPALIHGEVTEFNGVDDSGAGGYPRGSPVVFLYVSTTTGVKVNVTDFFHVVRTRDGPELISRNTKPARPGIVPGDFTLQTLDLSSAANPSAYFENPPRCAGSWRFALTLTNFFGQSPITAPDLVRCRS